MVIESCVGQSYDGASVDEWLFVWCPIEDQERRFLGNVQCYAHRLNLGVVDRCKPVKFATDFFALLQRIYVFISGSYVHPKWLKLQQQLHPNDRPIELKSLSQTRWSAQVAACGAVKQRLDVVLHLLDQTADDSNRDRASEAQSLALT